MLSQFFSDHGLEILPLVVLFFVFLAILSSWKRSRREKPDPPPIFGPIRGMYVCYQCDTIFNTRRCPACDEEATIPLIHLTGSIIEEPRLATLVGQMQNHNVWKLPVFEDFHNGRMATAAPRRKSSNGDASKIPAAIAAVKSEGDRNIREANQ